LSLRWFKVYAAEGEIVLDVFPYEPGGATLYLTPDVAQSLLKLIEQALKECE
jgi:hypothetical protein